MKKYSYKAVSKHGDYIKGKISAQNPSELSAILKNDGLEIISFKAETASILSFVDVRIKTNDLITTFVHLEQLDKAGVPIIDSISDLKESSDSPAIKSLMQEVYESIKNGNLFSEAMAKYPKIFSSVYVGLIANGEKTGNLSGAFASIVDDLKWNAEFKRKVRKASVGPAFAILMMMVIVGVMMGLVVPKVTGFLAMQDVKMPAATTALVAFSDFIQDNWLILIAIIPSLFFLLKALKRISGISVALDDFKLRLPIMGSIITKLDSARFCQFFSMTFKSGLGVIECLEAASMVIKNESIRRDISVIKIQVSEGQSLAKAISSNDHFPNLVVRMFKVGEESGNMEEALYNIKFFYDREINDSIDRLVSMIQPALTIFMGFMISWTVIAVFGPIYSTFSKIQ
jgi:type IV pilus assembly protein PilC